MSVFYDILNTLFDIFDIITMYKLMYFMVYLISKN